jgi:beta-mannanase
MEDYWPGSSWVDVLAFDGYNWGTSGGTRGGEKRWRTFDEICAGPYQRVAALDRRKPIWVAEVGCATAGSADPPGATKGGWLTDMLHSTTYRRLAAVVYFSADTDRDWRIVTPSDIAGWRAGWL